MTWICECGKAFPGPNAKRDLEFHQKHECKAQSFGYELPIALLMVVAFIYSLLC